MVFFFYFRFRAFNSASSAFSFFPKYLKNKMANINGKIVGQVKPATNIL